MQVYEATVGVPDLADGLRFYENLGFSAGPMGRLSRQEARRLYGVDSSLSAIRLFHQNADHGLIRLMQWEEPTGPGLGLAPLSALGSRWATHRTDDLAHLEFHARAALSQEDGNCRMVGPIGGPRPKREAHFKVRPFWDSIRGVREFGLFLPHSRHIFYSQYAFRVPHEAVVNSNCLFRTSHMARVGLIIQQDAQVLDFYVELFGMKRMAKPGVGDDNARAMYDLPDGDIEWHYYMVEDERSSRTDYNRTLPGRIVVLQFGPRVKLADMRSESSMGCLGMSAYGFHVAELPDVEKLRERVGRSAASEVGPVCANEFGEPSFSFQAPDGYGWIVAGG